MFRFHFHSDSDVNLTPSAHSLSEHNKIPFSPPIHIVHACLPSDSIFHNETDYKTYKIVRRTVHQSTNYLIKQTKSQHDSAASLSKFNSHNTFFFLVSSKWNLQTSVNQYFTHTGPFEWVMAIKQSGILFEVFTGRMASDIPRIIREIGW